MATKSEIGGNVFGFFVCDEFTPSAERLSPEEACESGVGILKGIGFVGIFVETNTKNKQLARAVLRACTHAPNTSDMCAHTAYAKHHVDHAHAYAHRHFQAR